MKVVVRYFSWTWTELPDEAGAAFAEQWTYDDKGALLERKRVPLANRARTVSTDPRAAAIMREEMGERDTLGSMSAPAWANK